MHLRLFAVLAGIALVGLTTSADANIALRYTLLSIAGVILGGGEFVGGRISPVGAVIGALTLTLAGSFLSFMRISPDWQIGAQGGILIVVLALRLFLNRLDRKGKAMSAVSVLTSRPWIWSFIATIAVWIITVLFTGGAGAAGLSHAAFTFASFSVIVGLGQMFVITLGPGNIDLSVPATMTLAATLALKLMDSQDSMVLAGLAVALLIGLCIGICNYALIKLLRIPPIIATLSMSFLIQSTAIWSNRGLRVKPPEVLAQFTTSSVLAFRMLPSWRCSCQS